MWGGADYDAIVPYYAPVYDDLVAQLEPRPGERFLAVATGTGEVALRAARAGARVTALDIAPDRDVVVGELARVWRLEGESGEAVFEFWSRVAPPTKASLDALDDATRAEARAALVAYWEGFREGGGRVSEPRRYTLVLGRRR